METGTRQPSGVAGWMMLFVIGQGLTVTIALAGMKSLLSEFSGEAWRFSARISYLHTLLTLEALMHIGQIILPIIGIALTFRRAPGAPLFWKAYLALLILYAIIDVGASKVVLGDFHRLLPERAWPAVDAAVHGAIVQNVRLFFFSVIWFLYWTVSVRVTNTFGDVAEAPAQSATAMNLYATPEEMGSAPDPFGRPQRECPACGSMILTAAEFCRYCRSAVSPAS
ncbi:MAG: DUF2569 family protein [Thermoanaerobaculia bacterium]